MTRLSKRRQESLDASWARVLTPPFAMDRHYDAIDLMLDAIETSLRTQRELAEIVALMLLASLPRRFP